MGAVVGGCLVPSLVYPGIGDDDVGDNNNINNNAGEHKLNNTYECINSDVDNGGIGNNKKSPIERFPWPAPSSFPPPLLPDYKTFPQAQDLCVTFECPVVLRFFASLLLSLF